MGRPPNAVPKIVVMRCDECGRPVGNRGYLKVDRFAAQQRRIGARVENGDGDTSKVATLDKLIFWKVLHRSCDDDPKSIDYRIASGRFTTTGDLLEATAFLMRNEP